MVCKSDINCWARPLPSAHNATGEWNTAMQWCADTVKERCLADVPRQSSTSEFKVYFLSELNRARKLLNVDTLSACVEMTVFHIRILRGHIVDGTHVML